MIKKLQILIVFVLRTFIFVSAPSFQLLAMTTLLRPSTLVAATVGTAVAGVLGRCYSVYHSHANHPAYAVYFDYRRRTDPEFRKNLKRESRRAARLALSEAEAQGAEHRQAIKAAVDGAEAEGFPTGVEEKEAFFMNEVARGETMCQEGKCFGSYASMANLQ